MNKDNTTEQREWEARSFIEEMHTENGNYHCTCHTCKKNNFRGIKGV